MRCDLAGILDYLPLWSWAVALHPKVFWLMMHVQSFERAYYLEHRMDVSGLFSSVALSVRCLDLV